MNINHYIKLLAIFTFWTATVFRTPAQVSIAFQNLDFEMPTFVPTGGLNTVQFAPAMPGWRGYLGAIEINWILYNDLFLSNPGIAIWGPNNPSPGLFHGQYYVVLQNSFPLATQVPAIAQTGTIPVTARSIQFYLAYGGMGVSFNGQSIPLTVLGSSPTGYNVYGGDISAFAGQTGEIRFRGAGYLDYIQFSNQTIPEPRALCLISFGVLLFGYRLRLTRRS